MPLTHMRWFVAVGLLVLGGGIPTFAQELNWAEQMFEERTHDFGIVARGADVRFRFKIKNKYRETVHFLIPRTTCMCATATLSSDTLQSLEEGYLEVSINTQQFSGEKSSTVVVTCDRPQYMEVRIPVKVYIRKDVVMTPGAVSFGPIEKGAGAERTVNIAYRGRGNWKIHNVKTNNKNISARVVERSRSGGDVAYDLFVNLDPNAPVGAVNDRILLETDDANSPFIPVLVTGQVEADITVTPGVLAFGQMPAGENKTINVVVRGKAPFVIEKIECESDKQAFRFRPPDGEKRVHVVPLTLTAPNEAGKFTEIFTVTVAGRKEPVVFRASAEIIAPAK